jgi:predicted DNA-binding transcriptional regulator AlpA
MKMQEIKLYRIKSVQQLIGLGKSSIWAKLNEKNKKQFDPFFPKPISLSATGKGAVAWRSDEVFAWIERRTELSRKLD